jgi:hypothetical protein
LTSSFEAGKNCASEDAAFCEGTGVGRAKKKLPYQNKENQENKQQNKICFARPRTGLDGPIWQGLGTMATGSNKTK